MARLSTEKLAMLKRAFTEDAMTPGQAAQAAGFWVFAGFLPVLAIGLIAAWRFTRE